METKREDVRNRRRIVPLSVTVRMVVAGIAIVATAAVFHSLHRQRRGVDLPFSASTQGTFQPTIPNRASQPAPARTGMVWIPGGEFSMGARGLLDSSEVGMHAVIDARPIHRVYVDGFFMDRNDVTNAEFAKFVAATGYITVAERTPQAKDFPGVPTVNLVPGSAVFSPPDHPVSLDDYRQWWSYVPGASWRHPTGPSSTIQGKENYPVVQVAFEDAVAYSAWAGKRLPSEAQWEFAARGGISGGVYVWGDVFQPKGTFMANTFEGQFPVRDTGPDGFTGIAPVAQFPPNGYGLYDMAGNVWQWTSDWYRPDYYGRLAAAGIARNPQGPSSSYDPLEPEQRKRVTRGGSFLCTSQYCARYVVGTRGKNEINSAANNLGFRCIVEVKSQNESGQIKPTRY